MRYDLKNIEVFGSGTFVFMNQFSNLKTFADNLLQELKFGTKDSNGKYYLKEDDWYPLDKDLDFFQKIFEKVGGRTIVNMGKKIPEYAVFPEGIDNIHKALGSINIAYHMNHRKNGVVMFNRQTGEILDGIGTYKYTPNANGKEGIIFCENPYLSEFDEGIITGMAKRFESNSTVILDSTKPTRRKGGDSCTFIVKW